MSLLSLHFLFIKSGRDKPVRFFFVRFSDITRRYALAALGAEQRSVILREINRALYYPVVIHFNKITFAHFLIFSDKAFAVGAAYFKNMAAPYFFAVRVFIYFHIPLTLGVF